jgi:hypothetical protein
MRYLIFAMCLIVGGFYASSKVEAHEMIPAYFAAENRIFKVKYLERKAFTVYIRDKDVLKVKYICTRSKLLKGGGPSRVSSKICSKIK